MFTHRMVVLLIFGRISFKFGKIMLRVTTSFMGYVLILLSHCVSMCKHTYLSMYVVKRSLIFGWRSVQIWYRHTKHYIRLHTFNVHAQQARVVITQMCMFAMYNPENLPEFILYLQI
jgi:hypothetical protein